MPFRIPVLKRTLGTYSDAKRILRACPVVTQPNPYRNDPLSHPDIARMPEREKADLPFDPRAIEP